MVKGPVNRKKRLLAAFVLLRRRRRKKKQAGQRRNYRSCARDEFRMKSNRLLEQMMAWKHRDKKWIQNVGMTYPTFKLLAQKIDHHGLLARKRKDGASIVERLLTVLNLFRYGKHLRDQEVQVGKAHNTIGRWRKDVCKALMQLLDELVQLPVEEQDLKDNANGFSRFKRSRMINCIGAIDGTHIRIASSDMAYRNYKKYNSINCQVICDHMFYIRHVMAGAPGCYSDKTMYTASGIDKWIKYIRTQNVLERRGTASGGGGIVAGTTGPSDRRIEQIEDGRVPSIERRACHLLLDARRTVVNYGGVVGYEDLFVVSSFGVVHLKMLFI